MNKTIVLLHYGRVPTGVARFFYHNLRHDYDVLMNEERPNRETMRFFLDQIAARSHLLFFLSRGTVHTLPADPIMRQLIEYGIDSGRNVVPVQLFGFRTTDYTQYFIGGLIGILRHMPLDFKIEDAANSLTNLRQRHLNQSIHGGLRAAPDEDSQQVSALQARLDALLQGTPDHLQAEVYFDEGQAAQQQRDLEAAFNLYSQAVELDPTHIGAINNRGTMRQQRGDLQGALDDYSRCIELLPTSPSGYFNRGNTYRIMGDYQHAERDYARAIELNPNHAATYNNRGFWLRYGQGDYEGAITDFNEAIRIDPNNANLLDSRAQAYFALGRFQEALADYRRAYELDPNMKIVRAGLGITYFALGYYRDAERHWRILAGIEKNYLDAEWVGERFGWGRPLIVAARSLIQRLANLSSRGTGRNR